MRKKSAGKSLSSDERDHRVSTHPRRCVSIRRCGRGKEYPRRLLAAPIGLAFDIDDRNHRTLLRFWLFTIFSDDSTQVIREGERFLETHLTIPHARESARRIRYNTEKQSGLIADLSLQRRERYQDIRTTVDCFPSVPRTTPSSAQPDVFTHRSPPVILLSIPGAGPLDRSAQMYPGQRFDRGRDSPVDFCIRGEDPTGHIHE